MISRALDSDALYDLQDEVLPEVALKKGKKRNSTRPNKGRAVSLGAVWEYNDDEDLEHGGDIDSHISKKRRTAPAKRSKSTKVPSKALSEIWDNGNAQQDYVEPDRGHSSQLTTPLDSGKKAKGRTTSSASQSKAKKTKPFKNPTITKPSVVREKEVEDNIPSSKPVSTHRGWITTQDAVKLNSNGIAKTTLDKLAAFRYKPSADFTHPATSTNLPVQRGDPSELDQQIGALELDHSSSDYGSVPSFASLFGGPPLTAPEVQIDDPFKEAEVQDPETTHFRQTEMLLDPSYDDFFTDALWNISSSNQAAPSNSQNAGNREIDQCQRDQSQSEVQQHPQANSMIHLDQSSHQSAPVLSNVSPKASASLAEPVEHVTSRFESTSSEARALNCLPDAVVIHQGDQHVFERFKSEIPSTQDRSSIAYLFSEGAVDAENSYDIDAFKAEEEVDDELLDSFPTSRREVDEVLPPSVSSNRLQLRVRMTEVQVERSDIDDVEATARDISKDYESDEFDEGLDDSDLLGIMSEAVIPVTQFFVQPKEREELGRLLHNQPMRSAPAQNAFTSDQPSKPALETSNPLLAIESHGPPSPQILSSEPDDEYPMDEDDEEMFKMPDLVITGVIENFQAPASLQHVFGDDPGSGEVYDSSLQFSPPKYRPTEVSPQKVHTNKASMAGSPERRSDIEPLPLSEEDDWNFLHSDRVATEAEVQVISEAGSESQQHVIMDRTERREYLSSVGSQACSHLPESSATTGSSTKTRLISIMQILEDSHEYRPLQPFARSDFPTLTRDRSPITGVSAQTFLRVCFRIGEMFKEGARCEALKQDAVIELFARVTFSSREPGTTKQHFQFADLWHDRPPFPNGILANYKTTGLMESESKAFLGADEGALARCLGRLKRDSKSGTGWMLHIINIRTTDWEEIKWTKRIVSAGFVKSERLGQSKL